MSNYTKSTNFATKDNLSPGDPLKIVRGTEIDTEFNNISTAISTKTDNSAAAITGGSITGITDLAIADGGTGASTATAALNNLLPSQTGNGTKYLQTDGSNATWDAVSLSTSDITGTLPVANGGTGVTSSTGTGSVVLSNSPTLVTPALGTPASGVATNITGLPISTGVSGLGTGVATFLGTPSSANLASAVSDETGSGALVFANSPTLVTPALGTPSALVGTNITGTASGLTAGNVTTNANLTGAVTSVGNATSLGSFSSANLLGALTDETGTGSAVFATSPTLVTPILGTPTSATLTNATGLPIATGVSGLGTGVATFLATPSSANLAAALTDETGSGANVFATSPTLVTPILGTPTSATLTNATGLPLTTGVTGTLPTANGGTNLGGATPFTSGGVVYASSTSALATGSALTFDGNGAFKSTGSTDGFISSTFVNTSAGTSAVNRIQIGNNTSDGAGQIVVYGGNHSTLASVMDINNANNADLRFLTNNTERVRLTSSSLYTASGINVGIGLSNPSSLYAGANNLVVGGGSGSTGMTIYSGTSDVGRLFFADGTSGADAYRGWVEYGHTGNEMTFGTNGGTKLTLTSAGNLGLGVPPSAWDSVYRAFQVGAQGAFWANATAADIYMSANYLYDGANKYIANGYASFYSQNAGAHIWKTAPNNTSGAGAAATFTQAMTLDASGNLGVGNTNPSSFDAFANRLVVGNGSTSQGITVFSGTASTGTINFADGTSGSAAYQGFVQYAHDSDSMNFYVNYAGSPSPRARIDASGNLLVGVTSSSFRFVVANSSASAMVYVGPASLSTSGGENAADAMMKFRADSTTTRSINAAGTINASGADYAEYMTKASDFNVAKGDVIGVDSQGKLTNVFSNAISFVVKSTNPSYVGGDTWGSGFDDDAEGLEAARQLVDRIAFSGQVPVNVLGATAGQYIIPINDNGAIKGQAISNPTFEQYQSAVGKVIAIEADGRARIIVKVA